MFLYPPRPEQAIAPGLIKLFEGRGYIGQIKKNGTCQVITIAKDGKVTFWTRRRELNKAWKPLLEMIEYFKKYRDSVFVGELLHNKHPDFKNQIILFDVLRIHGEDLVGHTLTNRLDILADVPPMMKRIQIATIFEKRLTELYYSLTHPIDEGIVLKDPKAKLETCIKEGMNSDWQVKCRRETKTYGY